MDLVCVTVDCVEPATVAGFWSQALGWKHQVALDGSGAICRPLHDGAYLEFVRVPEGKVVKNRLHLGCTAGPLDQLDAEITRLSELGASLAWEEEFPAEIAATYRNVVLRDVEGNEFCLGAGEAPRKRLDDVTIRPARAVDRVEILRLAERLAQTTPAWRDRTRVEDAIRQSITAVVDGASRAHAVFVAEMATGLVGFVTATQRRHFAGDIDASIGDLVVAETSEHRGVGRLLLEASEQWARQSGLQRITVETGATNRRALRLYRAHGFQAEDVRLTKQLSR